ncbi:hypothetical protein [Kineosporia babensis]|uniref:Uncharacterized protein n=1 Tax=Kineosporia babensis TaxID=499548 RepID=A0A9X1ND33_9ACTN|nr:hypothetical protein [Kineosporia babensis]MCD5311888.1 hypothetical protein [Kineosporia babensis]
MIAFAVLLAAGLIVAWATWADARHVHHDLRERRGRRISPPPDNPKARPQSLEGVLTQQLLSAEITRGQYQQAMTAAALREAVRHPGPPPLP